VDLERVPVFLEALVEAAEVVFLVFTSVSLSLLSLKMLLYFSTVLRFLLLFELAVLDFEAVPVTELVLLVMDDVVGVDEGFTEGEAWDPGDEEAAIAAFLAC